MKVTTNLAAALTFDQKGWGPRDTPEDRTYPLKVLTVPAGAWFVFAPVRIQWAGGLQTSGGTHVEWARPAPEPDEFRITDHLDIPAGPPGSHGVFPVACLIRCHLETTLVLQLTTGGVNVCDVVDGDALRVGFPA